MPRKPSDHRLKQTSSFYRYSTMGMQMLLTILLFVAAGYYLDRWVNLRFPLFTVVLSLAGVVGSMFIILRRLS